jgi:3-oxoacyl-[acyl-carrier protein] reductase
MNETKTALVTGGSRGIGRAICLELAQAGYFIIINYKTNEEAAAETLRLVRAAKSDGVTTKFDVSDSTATRPALDPILRQHPGIGILVNNAGISADGLFAIMPEESWHSVINTSLDGFFNVTKPVLKCMVRRRHGSIVAISSVSGLIGNRGQVNYSAAKAGLIGACRALAKEVARLGVRVNVVAPGLVETEMIKDAPVEMIKQLIPMERVGTPEEVAKAVLFLCSDDARYITGQVLPVNGGMF